MKYGLALVITDDGIRPGRLARLAEERGFESLFFPDHTHIPAMRATPFPHADGVLPPEYLRTLDPFVALTAAACESESLLIGTGVCLVPQRDPIITAKQVATLDHVSNGRLLFGVGAGWNIEEMRNHGTDASRRFSILREHIEAMKTIWIEDEASYHGEFVNFDRIWAWPKPLQHPHPPILVGGNGRRVHERVLAIGDEWYPVHEESLPTRISDLQTLAYEAGWPDPVPVTVQNPDIESIAAYAAVGVHRCVLRLPPLPESPVIRRLDELAIALDL